MEINNDQVNLREDKVIQAHMFNGENIIFSCPVIKQNHYGIWQKRNLLLTDVRLCNVKEQDIRRSIDITKIMGLTKN